MKKKQTKRRFTKNRMGIPRTPEQYARLDSDQQETWNRVIHTLSRMRSEHLPLQKASREAGISSRKVTTLGKGALRKDKRGRYQVKQTDNLLRFLVVPGADGLYEVPVRGSEMASTIARYSNAVQQYLRTGESSALRRFQGIKLTDADGDVIVLITTTAVLDRLGSAGVLSFESLYRRGF